MILAVCSLIAERYEERIRAIAPGVELAWPAGDGAWSGDAQAAEAAYFSEDFWTSGASRALLPQLFTLPNLRWFHTFSAGVDHPAFQSLLEVHGLNVRKIVGAAGKTTPPSTLPVPLRSLYVNLNRLACSVPSVAQFMIAVTTKSPRVRESR